MTTLLRAPARLFSTRQRKTHRARRTSLALLIGLLLVALVWLQRSGLQQASFSTGYALFGAIVFLLALHWRKQAPSLPLGRVAVWLQYHIYVGYLTILLFGLHIGFRLPSGMFDTALFTVFAIVAASGLYGIYVTRTVPRQLRMLPEEVVYEQIPQLRDQVIKEARDVIVLVAGTSQALAPFYKTNLAPFLEQRRGLGYYVYPNSRRRRLLTAQLRELHRFLSETQQRDCQTLERLLVRKDDLDFHAALQSRLKMWTFVHIGFSYSLLLLSIVHGIVVHAFSGAMP